MFWAEFIDAMRKFAKSKNITHEAFLLADARIAEFVDFMDMNH